MLLYKYITYQQLTIVRKGWIPLHVVTDKLDPFELNRQTFKPKALTAEISPADYKSLLKAEYQSLPAGMQSLISFDYFCQQADKQQQSIKSEAKSRQIAISTPNLPSATPYQNLCGTSFNATACNPVLWTFLADRHQGLVLVFDSDSRSFSTTLSKQRFLLLKPVTYAEVRPEVDNPLKPFPALFHKGMEWSHEQEWRLIRPLNMADRNAQGQLVFRFQANSLKQIIIGANTAKAQQQALLNFLQADIRYKQVQLQRCLLDQKHYKLHIDNLSEACK